MSAKKTTVVENNTSVPKPSEKPTETPVTESAPAQPYNPLAEAPIEKEYAGGPAATTTAGQPPVSIPEHTYSRPPEEAEEVPHKELTKAEEQKKKQQQKPEPANPDMIGATSEEKEQGAVALAQVVLTTWEQLYAGLNTQFKISEKTVSRLQAKGEIDPQVRVPYKMGDATLAQVIIDYNNDAANLLVVEDEFKESVMPLLTSEFQKAGHGMSPRQQLGYLMVTKLVADGIKVYQFMGLKKDYLRFAREATGLSKRPTPPPPPAPAAPAEKTEVTESMPTDTVQDTVQDIPTYSDGSVPVRERTMTLQERALAKHLPKGVASANKSTQRKKTQGVGRPRGSGQSKIAAKKHLQNAKQRIEHDPVPTPKGKRGRPAGSKNKRK